ncbi:unnamed protein product [Spirodela intermedia]|uniref:Uncharacterized protein n=2 Tax=Spirodela intermedia TaxID=51605 RepID=A0A7I8IK35_SPIIN|nr:unnamed protein product [Spirodela intermedia]CAA6657337.1 unnamed protein product [Spirodela intermedia]CAA7393386.1 unnamed protein product [Spirodela intermedia]
MIRATSASQRTEISCAFFSSPDRRFEKVTCRLILFSILFSCTLPLPIPPTKPKADRSPPPQPKSTKKKKKQTTK